MSGSRQHLSLAGRLAGLFGGYSLCGRCVVAVASSLSLAIALLLRYDDRIFVCAQLILSHINKNGKFLIYNYCIPFYVQCVFICSTCSFSFALALLLDEMNELYV